jgi:transcriptional regulator with XRE-family HTH domain
MRADTEPKQSSTQPATIVTVSLPVDQALATVLRRLREERDESREVVAVRAGVSLTTLVKVELGASSPTWPTVRAIAKALNVSLRELAEAVEAEAAR